MNATVISPTAMICDSPPLDSVNPEMWYNVSVSLDGGAFISNATGTFRYYHEPTLSDVTPWLGPLEGGTVSTVSGNGFNQTNICKFTVRYEQKHLVADSITWDSFVVTSPAVNVSGAVVVSVSGNNQQFINDVTLHRRDTENTFEYYQLFRVESLKPEYLSNTGHSPLRIKAMQFD